MIRYHNYLWCLLVFASSIARADEAIHWVDDVDQAFEIAQRENKLVLLHFWHEQCAPCRRLERFVFQDNQVGRALDDHYVAVKVNTRSNPDVARKYHINSVPQDLVFLPSGQVVSQRISPSNTRGYLFMLSQVVESTQSPHAGAEVALARAIAYNDPTELPAIEKPSEGSRFPSRRRSMASRSLSDEAPSPEMARGPSGATVSPPAQPTVTSPTQPTPPAAQPKVSPASREMSRVAEAKPETQGREQVITNPFVTQKPSAPAVAQKSDVERAGYRPAPEANRVGAEVKTSGHDTSASGSSAIAGPPAAKPAGTLGGGQFRPQGGLPNPASNRPLASNSVTPPTREPAVSANEPTTKPVASRPKIGLDGYCPMTLVKDKQWIKGDRQFGCVHRGQVYLFTSQAYRDEFLKDPDQFAPTLSGYDPVVYAEEGRLVAGSREHGRFVDGRIVLFSGEETFTRFSQNPIRYVQSVRQAMSASDQVRR